MSQNALLRFVRLSCALVLGLSATAGHAALSQKDLEAMQLLVLGPKNNELKTCLDSSFGILQGLIAVAHAPDSKVKALLTEGEMSASQRGMREEQAALWEQHHSPAKLADFQFAWCVKERGLPALALGDTEEACFKLAMVPAYAALLKTGLKVSEAEATEKLVASWREQVKEDWLRKVAQAIYAADSAEKTLLVHRQIFMGCIAGEQSQ